MRRKIVLVTPPSHTHRTAEESLGIGYLAAVLRKARREVVIIDGWLDGLTVEQITEAVLNTQPRLLIGVSCYRSSLDDVALIVQKLRQNGCTTPIIGGGYGPTFHEEDFLNIGLDYVVIGEGETPLLELADTLSAHPRRVHRINGLSWKNGDQVVRNDKSVPIQHLDELPFPARDTIQTTIRLKNPVHIVTSRGCLAHCLFCSVVSFVRTMKDTLKWRFRSIQDIVDEIAHLHEFYGVSCFKIVDDSFIEPPRDAMWAERFAVELTRRGISIKFRTQIRADRVTEDIVAPLVSVGWFATSVGVENGSQTALKRMHKEAGMEDNLRALELLEKYRVYVQMGMILFDHETTMRELEENFVFLKSQKWPVTKGIFTEMYAAKGTPFTTLLERNGATLGSCEMNAVYQQSDPRVRLVYLALKQWHKSHCKVYDHAINPISAPKVLPEEGYRKYHSVCQRLYNLDIAFFEIALALVRNGADEVSVRKFTSDATAQNSEEHNEVLQSLLALDARYGLEYQAEGNPFIR